MNNPKVSVIIPTHNHAHFLPECIGSVKLQSYDNYEVIVVNNGSTDDTEEIVKKLSWDKLIYIYQNDTGSVAGPRNTGIRLARGKYVAFLDSDDIWYEKKLEKIINILESNKTIDIIAHDIFYVRKGKGKLPLHAIPIKENMYESLLIRNCLIGSATTVKRNVMLEIGGFDGNRNFVHAEDYETWLRLACLGKKFYFHNEILGEYRFHGSNNLTLDFETALSNERNVVNKHFRNFRSDSSFYRAILYRNRMCDIYFKLWTQYFFRKKYLKSFYNLFRCFYLNPIRLFSNFKTLLKTKNKFRI